MSFCNEIKKRFEIDGVGRALSRSHTHRRHYFFVFCFFQQKTQFVGWFSFYSGKNLER